MIFLPFDTKPIFSHCLSLSFNSPNSNMHGNVMNGIEKEINRQNKNEGVETKISVPKISAVLHVHY